MAQSGPPLKLQNFFDRNGLRKFKGNLNPKINKAPILIPEIQVAPPLNSPVNVSPIFSNEMFMQPRASLVSINSLATTSAETPPFEVSFKFFIPLIRELKQKAEKISRRCQTAEHHRRIGCALLDRVLIADDAVRYFNQDDENFWRSKHNYRCVQRLAEVVERIDDFVRNVSHLRRYRKFVKRNNVQLTFGRLATDIDNVLKDLNIITPLAVQFQRGQDLKMVEDDLNDMLKFLQGIQGGLTDSTGQVSREIEEISFQLRKPLPSPSLAASAIIDSETVERSNPPFQPSANVEKATWRNQEVALKRVKCSYKENDDACKNKVRHNVAVLKKIEASNIILFHGVMEEWDESKRAKVLYVITEWAHFGNLREYYKNVGPLSWTKKLSLAVDISRAMIYLRAIDLLHHDLSPDAVLITSDHRAKVSGCEISFPAAADSRRNSSDRDKDRYVAPEILKSDFPYDVKCQVYSFGMLLLEIAEENIPLHGHANNAIDALRENTYRQSELFTRTKMAPKEYRKLVFSAISYERNRRPSFSELFLSLNDMFKRCNANAVHEAPETLPTTDGDGEILIGLSDELARSLLLQNLQDSELNTVI